MKTTNMLMLATILLFSACSKKGNDPEVIVDPVSKTCQIVTVEEVNESPITYTYDDQGRVLKVTELYGFGTGTFTYSAGKVTFKDSNDGTNKEFNTDTQGRIVSDSRDTYKYNADGYLTEKNDGSIPAEFVLTYTNGNLVKVVTDGKETSDITYYEDEINQNLMGFENPLFSGLLFNHHTFSSLTATFMGKPSKNLVKSITVVEKDASTGLNVQTTETYTYQKDSDGKVTSQTVKRDAPSGSYSGVSTLNFSYNCK